MPSFFLLYLLAFGCAQNATPAAKIAYETPVQAEQTDCPEGVKIACNVPNVTQNALEQNQAVIQQCIADCIQALQPESVSAQQLQQECESSCNEEHFIGQVEVAPSTGETPK